MQTSRQDCVSRADVAGGTAEYERWWDRVRPLWHGLYLGLLLLSALATAFATSTDARERWLVLALLAIMAASYLILGYRLFDKPGGVRAATHLSVTWLSFYAIVLITDGNTPAYYVLFALFPQIWAYLTPRVAAVTSVVVIGAEAFVEVSLEGLTWDAVAERAPDAILQTGLVMLLGLLIVGVVRQTEQRAALIEELEATRSELADTERSRGVLAERERLAHEIHDTLAQGFTSILTLSQAIEASLDRDPDAVRHRLTLLERTARENLAETRALVGALAPVDLQGNTLPDALERVVGRWTEETGIPVELKLDGSRPTLPTVVEIVLLRAAQEALTNVGRHAGASHVQVTFTVVPDGHGLATVSIVDDGKGFESDKPAGGFGLRGMRARAQQAGGGLEVISAPGGGASVRVHVPIHQQAAEPSG